VVLQETSAYCEHCRRPVLGRRDGPNHLVHALVSLFLCGLWIPVWIIAALSTGGYACPTCGGRVSAFPQQPGSPVRQLSPEEEGAIAARRSRVNRIIAVALGLFFVALIALAVTAFVTKQ
jgi:hypothetical protein